MVSPDIPQHVLQFIAEKVDTVPQLETLLLLREDDTRCWSEDEIAARVYVTRETARSILRTLQRHQLILAEGDPERYCYGPRQDGSRELICEVAAAYRRHLVSIATFIHSKASASVLEFARAFDLKKGR